MRNQNLLSTHSSPVWHLPLALLSLLLETEPSLGVSLLVAYFWSTLLKIDYLLSWSNRTRDRTRARLYWQMVLVLSRVPSDLHTFRYWLNSLYRFASASFNNKSSRYSVFLIVLSKRSVELTFNTIIITFFHHMLYRNRIKHLWKMQIIYIKQKDCSISETDVIKSLSIFKHYKKSIWCKFSVKNNFIEYHRADCPTRRVKRAFKSLSGVWKCCWNII